MLVMFCSAQSWKDLVGLPTAQINPFFLYKGYLKVGQISESQRLHGLFCHYTIAHFLAMCNYWLATLAC